VCMYVCVRACVRVHVHPCACDEGLTKIVHQDPIFILLHLLTPSGPTEATHMVAVVVPEQSTGEPLEHPGA